MLGFRLKLPVFMVALLFVNLASGLTLITHSVDGKVFTDDQGEMRGIRHSGRRAFNIELVRSMMVKVGHTPRRFEVMPFKRAFTLVQNEPNLALFNVARRPSREALMKWVGPLQEDIHQLYVSADAQVQIPSIELAKQLNAICVLTGNNHHTYFNKMGFKNIYPAPSYEVCFSLLAKGRVSAAVIADNSLSETLREAGVAINEVKAAFELYRTQGYMAFSPDTPQNIILRWQHALDKLKVEGVYDELVKQYLNEGHLK